MTENNLPSAEDLNLPSEIATIEPNNAIAPGFIPRAHGVVLTNASLKELQSCVKDHGGYDTLKVVTAWGLLNSDHSGKSWDDSTRKQVCQMTPNTIVRSKTGDGNLPDANQVISEIRPWYAVKQNIFIELGNEPNLPANNNNNDFIWQWRWYLNACIDACHREFPNAKLISPGLAPGSNPQPWYEIANDVMKRCDYIGFHTYADFDFRANQGGRRDITNTINLLKKFFSDKSWIATEYAINDPLSNQGGMFEKGRRYAGFVHYGESETPLPSNVWGAIYFHLDTLNGGSQSIYPNGDDGYKSRT